MDETDAASREGTGTESASAVLSAAAFVNVALSSRKAWTAAGAALLLVTGVLAFLLPPLLDRG